MRLADFISSNIEPILADWEGFARSISAGDMLDRLSLRDHAGQILQATARDMKTWQTVAQRDEKSKGEPPQTRAGDALDGASDLHAIDRLQLGFNILDVLSEYRALRAGVLKLWLASLPEAHELDVNDVTRFNESIDQSVAQAVASYTSRVDQARDMFLAILSHDLRNPLSAISMSAHMMPLQYDDKAKVTEGALRIARSASVMQRMILDLLDYTRTRLGAGMPVVPAPLNLASVGRELFEEFRAAHPEREIRFASDGDLRGLWDSDRIRQAISNLMGNAIQHGAADFPVMLSLRGDASNVFVVVHNGGDPIPPSAMPTLFDPLVRGMSAEHRSPDRPGSIGMGLYIAREVARSHGGQIDVLSTRQEGTSFTIRLPRNAAPRVGQPILDAEHISRM